MLMIIIQGLRAIKKYWLSDLNGKVRMRRLCFRKKTIMAIILFIRNHIIGFYGYLKLFTGR